MDVNRELTTIFMPSFLDTILKGLNALRALKPLKKLTLTVTESIESKIQLITENVTIIKSNIFHGSLK